MDPWGSGNDFTSYLLTHIHMQMGLITMHGIYCSWPERLWQISFRKFTARGELLSASVSRHQPTSAGCACRREWLTVTTGRSINIHVVPQTLTAECWKIYARQRCDPTTNYYCRLYAGTLSPSSDSSQTDSTGGQRITHHLMAANG